MGTTRERPVFDSSIVSAPVRKSAQRQGQPALLTPPQASVETYEEQRPMLGTERPVERAFARWGEVDDAPSGLIVARDARDGITGKEPVPHGTREHPLEQGPIAVTGSRPPGGQQLRQKGLHASGRDLIESERAECAAQ